MANYNYTKDILHLIPIFKKICSDPFGDEIYVLVSPMWRELGAMERSLDEMATRLWAQAMEEGLVKPTVEADAIVSETYAFKSIYLAGGFLSVLGLQIMSLRMLHDLGSIYGSPSRALYDKLRDLCMRLWSLVPYLRSLESIVSVSMLNLVFTTYAFADVREKDYLLDTILIMDGYLHQLPRDKIELDAVVMADVRQLNGESISYEGSKPETVAFRHYGGNDEKESEKEIGGTGKEKAA